ncbi:hypothetical protein QQX98_005049 [Neonectria punicea]|uniref:Uncharacterized protein n=1 Tax=Neonectria punicea TaxID=979145 RepID=A0ABR1H6H5_9HYPO
MPSCDDGSQAYTGPYADKEGEYVTSAGISHPYKFPLIRRCAWDYFIVEASIEYLPWQKATGDIYCTATATCAVTKLTGSETCQTRSEAISPSVGFIIQGVTLGLEVTITNEESHCETASDTTACTWNDGQCHTVWTQQQVLRQRGYRRHRCNYDPEARCMSDWTMDTPNTQINYGCGSACTDTNNCGNTSGQNC